MDQEIYQASEQYSLTWMFVTRLVTSHYILTFVKHGGKKKVKFLFSALVIFEGSIFDTCSFKFHELKFERQNGDHASKMV
jgi:hypothetical protein